MLERVWRKGNPLTLLVGMQTSTATLPDHQRKDFPMNRNIRFLLTAAAVLPAFLAVPASMAQDEKAQAETAQTPAEKETIAKIRKLMDEGNYKESADAARAALEAIPAKSQSEAVGTLWNMYRASLFSNNRVKEYDDAYEFVTSRFPKNVSLNKYKACMCAQSLSRVGLFVTL